MSTRITLASLLRHASDETWSIPLALVLERLAALKPCYYSIASAFSGRPNQIPISVSSISVSENTLDLDGAGEVVHGLTSHCLKDMTREQAPLRAYCHVRKSKSRAQSMPSRPMIMVATGSGIAPLRDFTQHLVERADNGKDIGSTCVLYFV